MTRAPLFLLAAAVLLAVPAEARGDMPGNDPAAPTVEPGTRVPPEELDRAISSVMSQREYLWRLPREKPDRQDADATFLGAFLDQLAQTFARAFRAVWRVLKKFIRWLDDLFGHIETPDDQSADWQTPVQALLFILLAFVLSILAILLYRYWRRRGRSADAVAMPAALTPDLNDEDLAADELPSDRWMEIARDLLRRGEIRLAVRAMFLACLAHLSMQDRIAVSRHKSNRDYVRELARRARDLPELQQAFKENVAVLERAWYGRHQIAPDVLDAFVRRHAAILGKGAAP